MNNNKRAKLFMWLIFNHIAFLRLKKVSQNETVVSHFETLFTLLFFSLVLQFFQLAVSRAITMNSLKDWLTNCAPHKKRECDFLMDSAKRLGG